MNWMDRRKFRKIKFSGAIPSVISGIPLFYVQFFQLVAIGGPGQPGYTGGMGLVSFGFAKQVLMVTEENLFFRKSIKIRGNGAVVVLAYEGV